MAGKTAVWLDLAIPVFIPALSSISFTAVSRQVTIGTATMTFEEIAQSQRDNFGNVIMQKLFRTFDGEITGSLQIRIRIEKDEKNLSDLNQNFIFSGGTSSSPSNNALPPWKTISSIPFVLRILKITAFDIIGFADRLHQPLIIQINHLNWSKQTASKTKFDASAEWVDNDWCFIIFQLDLSLEILLRTADSLEIGSISINISDIMMSPVNGNGLTEISGLLFRNQQSTAKVMLQMSTAPYMSPEEKDRMEMEKKVLLASVGPKRTLGYLRIKSIEVKILSQVYGLFANSPKVIIRLHHWSASTSVALDGGNNYVWDTIEWGKIPLKEHSMLHVTVSSWNEVIGSLSIQWKDLISYFSAGANRSVVISGDISNGIVAKGRVELVCLPLLTVEESDLDFPESSEEAFEDTSFENTTEVSPDRITGNFNTNIIALESLSLSTSTPALISAKVLGVSVYKLKPLNTVIKNSPSVTMISGNWVANTGAVLFGGDSANWILQNNNLWTFKMKGMSFIMISVQSSNTVIGSVVISSRDIVAVEKDEQGLTYITRPIENSLTITGYVKICLNIDAVFDEEDVNIADSLAPKTFRPDISTTSLSKAPTLKYDRLTIPFTLNILGITALDILTDSYLPSKLCVEIKCGRQCQRTKKSFLASRHELWSDLDWRFHVLDEDMFVYVSVLSGMSLAGQAVLTVSDILLSSRTAQGFTELQCVIRQGVQITGKVRIDALVTEYVSPDKKETLAIDAERKMSEYLNSLKPIGSLSLNIVSAMDVSLTYVNLILSATFGAWSAKSHRAFNNKGYLVWGNFDSEWKDISILERSSMVITLETLEETPYSLGRLTISSHELLTLPRDKDGVVVIEGNVMDGLICKAKLSIACKVTILALDDSVNNDVIVLPERNGKFDDEVVTGYDNQRATVVGASASKLAPVHKLGRNAPMLKMEINGLQNRSDSIPGGGSTASWTNLYWNIELKRTTKIKISVTSGSALIGSVIFSSKEIIDFCKNEEFDGNMTLTKQIVNKNSDSGEVSLLLTFPAKEKRKKGLNTFVGVVEAETSIDNTTNSPTKSSIDLVMNGGISLLPNDPLVAGSLFSNMNNSGGDFSIPSIKVDEPSTITNTATIFPSDISTRTESSRRPKTSRGSESFILGGLGTALKGGDSATESSSESYFVGSVQSRTTGSPQSTNELRSAFSRSPQTSQESSFPRTLSTNYSQLSRESSFSSDSADTSYYTSQHSQSQTQSFYSQSRSDTTDGDTFQDSNSVFESTIDDDLSSSLVSDTNLSRSEISISNSTLPTNSHYTTITGSRTTPNSRSTISRTEPSSAGITGSTSYFHPSAAASSGYFTDNSESYSDNYSVGSAPLDTDAENESISHSRLLLKSSSARVTTSSPGSPESDPRSFSSTSSRTIYDSESVSHPSLGSNIVNSKSDNQGESDRRLTSEASSASKTDSHSESDPPVQLDTSSSNSRTDQPKSESHRQLPLEASSASESDFRSESDFLLSMEATSSANSRSGQSKSDNLLSFEASSTISATSEVRSNFSYSSLDCKGNSSDSIQASSSSFDAKSSNDGTVSTFLKPLIYFEKSAMSHPESDIFSSDFPKQTIANTDLAPVVGEPDENEGSQSSRSYGESESARPETATSTSSRSSIYSDSYSDGSGTSGSWTSRSSYSNNSEYSAADMESALISRNAHRAYSGSSATANFHPRSILKSSNQYRSRRALSEAAQEIAKNLSFDVQLLRWWPLGERKGEIIQHFSLQYTRAILFDVTSSLIAVAEGRNYQPRLLPELMTSLNVNGFPIQVTQNLHDRRMLNYVVSFSNRFDVIRYHCQVCVEFYLQAGGTNAMKKIFAVSFEESASLQEISNDTFGM